MCKEGGCGACIVTVTSKHPQTGKDYTYAVNSCLLKVWSCNRANITTIESAKEYQYPGSKDTISNELANKNGSQCGYCSPAMVMNLYGLIQGSDTKKISAEDVEKNFAGNICRCTGYKPILEAFRGIVDPKSVDNVLDIEDVGCLRKCQRKPSVSDDEDYESCFLEYALALTNPSLNFKDGKCWKIPQTVKDIIEIFDQIGTKSYMLINGNTAAGVAPAIFRDTPVQVYIDVRNIRELRSYDINDNNIELGANITLSDLIQVLQQVQSRSNFKYAKELVHHLKLVANVPVRNTGTVAGNLMLKYKMLQKGIMFQSDVFLLLELIGADVQIEERSNVTRSYKPSEMMRPDFNMDRKVITKIILPSIDSSIHLIRTYKIMPRAQNAPAAVNAGFLFKMNKSKPTYVDDAVIVYGGINPTFVHAKSAETFLRGKDISNEKVLQQAISKVKNDVSETPDVPVAQYLYPGVYRQQLAVNLYYKTILYFNNKKKVNINAQYKSAMKKLEDTRKQLSSGVTSINIPVDKARGKLIPKLEAHIQCKGEAEYVNDIPVIHDQLYGAMVIAPRGPGVLEKIDTSQAEKMPGFVKFYQAKDIPGKNAVVLTNKIVTPEQEELFCSKDVLYAGQLVGILIAKSQDQASAAARKVVVTVRDNPEKLLYIDDVLNKYQQKYPNERILLTELPAPASDFEDVQKQDDSGAERQVIQSNDDVRIKGEFNMGSQYHYSMELHTCAVFPKEDGQFDVYSSTQWPLSIQEAVALVLGIMDTKVTVTVRRVGGAYGAKVTRGIFTAAACALASYKLNQPVRMVMDLETHTKSMGKRCALKCYYDLTADKKTGKITKINQLDFLDDKGCTLNEPIFLFIPGGVTSCYDISSLLYPKGRKPFNIYSVKTDTPSSAWCRAPGSLEGVTVIETIMNAIAETLNIDPYQVRLSNISQTNNKPFYDFFTDRSNKINFVEKRKAVQTFNQKNKWRKQGFSILPMTFPIDFYYQFYCTVSIHEGDGSISISHGGTEIGQGVNTKAAVAAAYIFGLDDVSNIQVKPTNIVYSPNATLTGGSMTSDAVTYACMKCCKAIKARIDLLIKEQHLSKDMKWPELIQTAYSYAVNLTQTYMWKLDSPKAKVDPDIGNLNNYSVSAVCATTVEVDILTGQHIVREVTLYEDAGKSFAPLVDLGQIQGAFIMGLGYFTSEEITYDKSDGNLINTRTWTYDVPGFLDIPEVFNIYVENDEALGRRNPGELAGVMGAKASGEPPLCLSSSVFFAIREAIKDARKNAVETKTPDFKNFYPPAKIAQKVLFSSINTDQFKIQN